MLDFEIQRCTRRCAATERELQPGEPFYSVLVADGAAVLRYDYSEAAWTAPPENAIGWWKSRMPTTTGNKVHWAPNEVMLHYLDRMSADPNQADMVYVLALLLSRRRVLRLDGNETDAEGRETLVLSDPKNENEYRIPVVWPTAARINEIQETLAGILFGDAEIEIDTASETGDDHGPDDADGPEDADPASDETGLKDDAEGDSDCEDLSESE